MRKEVFLINSILIFELMKKQTNPRTNQMDCFLMK